jgi:hypothetical protein
MPPEGSAPVFGGVVSRPEATHDLRERDVLLRATDEEPEMPPSLLEAATGPDA